MSIIEICHVTKQKSAVIIVNMALNSYPHRLDQIFPHTFFRPNYTFLKQPEIDSERNGDGGLSQWGERGHSVSQTFKQINLTMRLEIKKKKY